MADLETHGPITAEDVPAISARLRETAREQGPVIDETAEPADD